MYHRIGEEERDPLLRRFTVSRRRFEAQMRCLARLRCRPVSPEEIARWLEGGPPLPPRPVAITFDDGYEETYHVAAPILEAHGLRATVFVVSDYAGRRSTWDADVAPAGDGFPLMSWEQARDLARRGHTLGSHTRTHPELPDLDDKNLAAELLGSRLDLQRRLGRRVHLLAYPYSRVDTRCREAARAAGYRAACAGEGIDYDRWCLDRVNPAEASLPLFLAKLSPWFYLFRRARARRW